ncbi:MAG: GMC family oxidoreductase [Polyangia bacterium]
MTAPRIVSARDGELPPKLSQATFDLIVVGSGAGGSMCAQQAAQAGLSVLVLEAGGHHLPSQMNQLEGDMLPRLFYDAGGRSTQDGAVMILHGRGIGGSTVHNTNLCKRAPAEVLQRWATSHDCPSWSPERVAPDYEAVETELSVTPLTEEDVNRNNAIMRRGVEKLGWRGGLLQHNRRGCQRSGFCELGCAYDAKENAAKVVIPKALLFGASVICDLRVVRILHDGKRVRGVSASVVRSDGSDGETLNISARAVCVSASAVLSPALLLHSDVPDPHKLVGKSLRLHPGVAVGGCFAEPVEAWKGIPQAYECSEKLSFSDGAQDRCWLIPAFAHPGGFAGLQPGFGKQHAAAMRDYAKTAVVAAMLHDETKGVVSVDRNGRAKVDYALTESDAKALLRGIGAAADILLAAGAQEVMIPFARPLLVRSPKELSVLDSHRYRPLDPILTSVHPMGSLPMGLNPTRAVVDEQGRHHQLHGLYVADGSLFPTSLGGPPQLTIYATGRRVGNAIAADLRHG